MPKFLHKKYIISKADGTPIDKNAEYFILRLDTDSTARTVLRNYSLLIRKENPVFSAEIDDWVNSIERKLEGFTS